MEQPKRSSTMAWILVILLLAVSNGAWYVYTTYVVSQPDESTGSKVIVKTPAPKVTPTPSPTTTGEINKTNTTYTNKLGNFSFQTPENYIVLRGGNCEGLCSDILTIGKLKNDIAYEKSGVTIQVWEHETLTLEQWNKEMNYNPLKESGTIEIGGTTATKYDNSGLFEVTDYRFVKGNFLYNISMENSNQEKKDLVDKIINTFQFTS
jgi:hypothetical protein